MAYYDLQDFPPGHRLAYDRDGSAVYNYESNGTPVHPVQADYKLINDEIDAGIRIGETGTVSGNGAIFAVVFPVEVHLLGAYYAVSGTPTSPLVPRLEVSSDSDNGVGGVWTTAYDEGQAMHRLAWNTYRSQITVLDLENVKAVRIPVVRTSNSSNRVLHALHLYAAEQHGFLQFWHPSEDRQLTPQELNWGNIYAGLTYDRQLRVKNVRSQTAVDVSVSTLTHTGAEMDTYHRFSLTGGVPWFRPLTIGNLAPGAISAVIHQQLIVPETATVQEYATQLSAIPASWAT